MKIASLQSNYLPWTGVFELINSVDKFIFSDNNQYTKQDWRNRNKINDTDSSRVSIDFRFLPKDKYNLESVNHSYSHNKKFIIGEYWDV